MTALLQIENLQHAYGERRVLNGLSVAINEGEIFGFLGPNGAGKSTTFRILSGLLRAQAGTLTFRGAPISFHDATARRHIGVVFQEPSLDDKLTGRENMWLGASLYALPRATANARVEKLLELVELRDRAGEPVERYSGGMRRRLELARVLLTEPELLIMDEPARGIDQPTLRKIWLQLLDEQRQRSLTILLTTHQPDEAEYCHRIGILAEGRIAACDTPDNLKRQVGGDLLILEGADLDALLGEVRAKFPEAAAARIEERSIVIEVAEAHRLIPRIVEALPAQALTSVSLRRPSLGDVVYRLTGRKLPTAEASA